MPMTSKFIRDGKVAALVSIGYGSGWSTWNGNSEDMLFDPDIVSRILNDVSRDEIAEFAEQKYPEAYVGGVYGLIVVWVPCGAVFRINEYDGAENLVLQENDSWHTA